MGVMMSEAAGGTRCENDHDHDHGAGVEVGGAIRVSRLDLGHFIRPAAETGTGHPRAEPVFAHLVRHPRGFLLFDSGIGAGDAEADAHYRPHRRSLPAALAAEGVAVEEIAMVVNCHLHFDHLGGNPLFPGVPIVVQRTELATARAGDHTIDALVDFPGAVYEEVDGEVEPWPGLRIVPTPGHTPGHQSLWVERPGGGSVLLAGQAYDFASEYAAAELARRVVAEGLAPPLPPYRPWLDRIARLAPRTVCFAHDAAVYVPPPGGAPRALRP
ncbi:N-acyl homoserine lactonase family protein [Streptomyces sp. NPDC047315]|uniref:N-acyl homoserine lactonase family protein n=1 Tax=Streptomyces sp. NPDC047315 TaxID=3155142 RepID=UPI0034038D90